MEVMGEAGEKWQGTDCCDIRRREAWSRTDRMPVHGRGWHESFPAAVCHEASRWQDLKTLSLCVICRSRAEKGRNWGALPGLVNSPATPPPVAD